MSKENTEAVVITDESKIEAALSKLRFGVSGAGGGNDIGGMHKQPIARGAILEVRRIVRDADPVILVKARQRLKRKDKPTSADFTGTI